MVRATLATVTAIIVAGATTVVGAGAPGASAHSCAKKGEFRIRAADRTRLAGHRFGRGPTAVVFAHELRGGACQWIPYARTLAARGYLTIAFDFRGYGASQNRYGDAAFRQPADVTAMAKRARALGAKKVILVGASMGGTAVVIAAANARPMVDGVVSLSAPSTFGVMNGVAAAKKLIMPVLYAVGSRDEGFVDGSRMLYDATGSTDKRLEIVDSDDHGVDLLDDRGARAVVEQFIAKHART
jgi:pimeloyl-ACP methyl ester carboxylesterase